MNSFSTSITPGERVSFEGEVLGSLVVTIVEGVTRATVSGTKGTDDNHKGVFIDTSVLATKEAVLVIIGSRSTTSAGDFKLIINSKPVVAEAKNVVGMETGPLVDSN